MAASIGTLAASIGTEVQRYYCRADANLPIGRWTSVRTVDPMERMAQILC
jgi:hypothetical protein